jgi:hypothetical protein
MKPGTPPSPPRATMPRRRSGRRSCHLPSRLRSRRIRNDSPAAQLDETSGAVNRWKTSSMVIGTQQISVGKQVGPASRRPTTPAHHAGPPRRPTTPAHHAGPPRRPTTPAHHAGPPRKCSPRPLAAGRSFQFHWWAGVRGDCIRCNVCDWMTDCVGSPATLSHPTKTTKPDSFSVPAIRFWHVFGTFCSPV